MALQCMGCCGASRIAQTNYFNDLRNSLQSPPKELWETQKNMLPEESEAENIAAKVLEENIEDESDAKDQKPRHVRWLIRPLNTRELRHTAPIVVGKLLDGQKPPVLKQKDIHWVRQVEPPLRCFTRSVTEIYPSHWTSRCERGSTLRDLLPSEGGYTKISPPKWGVGPCLPPIRSKTYPDRFPGVTSSMAGYVDNIHQNNRLFKMY